MEIALLEMHTNKFELTDSELVRFKYQYGRYIYYALSTLLSDEIKDKKSYFDSNLGVLESYKKHIVSRLSTYKKKDYYLKCLRELLISNPNDKELRKEIQYLLSTYNNNEKFEPYEEENIDYLVKNNYMKRLPRKDDELVFDKRLDRYIKELIHKMYQHHKSK